MAKRLEGKTALVTGATSGIGKAIAQAMAAEGAHIIVSGRNAERGAQVVASIMEIGERAEFIATDLADGSLAVSGLAAKALAATDGHLDILVNNAAFLMNATSTTDTTEETIDRALSTSVKAPLLLTAALVPAMVERGYGVIVNIGSISGLVGMEGGTTLYSSTKAALHALTKAWAVEYGPSGVRVNTVAPGPTLTEFTEDKRERINGFIPRIPSRRLSTPAEVAAAVVFLASEDATNIHGVTLSVDGGLSIV